MGNAPRRPSSLVLRVRDEPWADVSAGTRNEFLDPGRTVRRPRESVHEAAPRCIRTAPWTSELPGLEAARRLGAGRRPKIGQIAIFHEFLKPRLSGSPSESIRVRRCHRGDASALVAGRADGFAAAAALESRGPCSRGP